MADPYNRAHIRGDSVFFMGFLVARLATNVPATVAADFEQGMNAGDLFDDGPIEPPAKLLFQEAKKASLGGLITIKELHTILDRIKDETTSS